MSRRTWAELLAGLADNTAGEITAEDVRSIVDSVRPHVAGAAPTTSADSNAGFDVGSSWLDTSAPALYECRDAAIGAAAWVRVWPQDASAPAWGDLTGTLSDQTDLQNALNAKADASSLATVATSGDYTDLSNRPTLGSAAAANTGDFATAAQGGKADTALQPGDELTDLTSAGATAGHVPKADGNGSISWAAESGGDTSGLLPKLATVNPYAGNRTLNNDDSGAYVRITAAGTVTLPDGLDTGFQCVVVNATDAATVELAAATTLTLPTGFEPEIQNRRAVTVIHVGSDVWEAHGALVES